MHHSLAIHEPLLLQRLSVVHLDGITEDLTHGTWPGFGGAGVDLVQAAPEIAVSLFGVLRGYPLLDAAGVENVGCAKVTEGRGWSWGRHGEGEE